MKNIKILLKKPNDEESLILMVYRYRGHKLTMSLNERVFTKYWNPRKMRVKAVSSYPEHRRLNYVIDNWTDALSQAITHFDVSGCIPTVVQLKEEARRIRYPDSDKSGSHYNNKVVNSLGKYILQIKNERRLSTGTIQSYDQLYNNLITFKDARSLTFRDISLDRLKAFTNHLNRSTNSKKQYSQGTINKLQRRLGYFLTVMKEYGVEVDPSYKSKAWKVTQPKVSGNDFALTKTELNKIENVHLSKSLDGYRDRFLIGIYTGQRYSDFKNISATDMAAEKGIPTIRIRQQKTNTTIAVPVIRKLRDIFEKYDGHPPSYSEASFNNNIKIIFDKAGIHDTVKVETQYIDRIEANYVRKCDLVSSHTCRRTFVTLAIQANIPLPEVMKVSGHKNLKTLSQYMKGGLDINSDSQDLYENLF